MLKSYFKNKGGPAPIITEVKRRVRFEEVDRMGIVWHGRYVSYFEDARVALGKKYGIGYMGFFANGVLVPIKKIHMDYHRPLLFEDEVTVEALLHWSDAARINFEFKIYNAKGQLTTDGYSVQIMLNLDRELLLAHPPFYEDFRKMWKAGKIN